MNREQAIEHAKLYLHTQTAAQLAHLLSRMTGKLHTCSGYAEVGYQIHMTDDDTRDVWFIEEYFGGYEDSELTFKQMVEMIKNNQMPPEMYLYTNYEDQDPVVVYNRFYSSAF